MIATAQLVKAITAREKRERDTDRHFENYDGQQVAELAKLHPDAEIVLGCYSGFEVRTKLKSGAMSQWWHEESMMYMEYRLAWIVENQ